MKELNHFHYRSYYYDNLQLFKFYKTMTRDYHFLNSFNRIHFLYTKQITFMFPSILFYPRFSFRYKEHYEHLILSLFVYSLSTVWLGATPKEYFTPSIVNKLLIQLENYDFNGNLDLFHQKINKLKRCTSINEKYFDFVFNCSVKIIKQEKDEKEKMTKIKNTISLFIEDNLYFVYFKKEHLITLSDLLKN